MAERECKLEFFLLGIVEGGLISTTLLYEN